MPIAETLARLKGRVLRFLCTGNDLEFVRRKVPKAILDQMDGHVLETGCSASRDGETEEVLTTEPEQATIRELTALLRAADFPEINYFAHRLTTISMFCDDPPAFFEKTRAFVQPTRFQPLVHVTYSSVAVDVLPQGYNKYQGLAKVAEGKKTIGIADSMNDRALLEESDFALAPANLAPELVPLLEKAGRKIVPLPAATGLMPATVIKASRRETEGVLEILAFLDRVLPGRAKNGVGG
jgi:hydroxymethylpyrimidine pyrophosphatase-like HAD family hydrolase